MLIKRLSLCVVTILLLFVLGCKGVPQDKTAVKNVGQPLNEIITIGFISGGQSSPQALINYDTDIFNEQLKDIGKKAKLDATRSLDNVWPKMDNGEWDFVYVPTGNFGTYVTKTSRFGGSDKYVVLAGSLNRNGANVIIAKPEINSIKDLAGKKIGIANLRYWDEYQLNKLLATQGLATKPMGGNVDIVWDDIVPKQAENWAQGNYDAVIIYSLDNIPDFLNKVKGSKILADVNAGEIFGKNSPKYWLAAKKELVKNEPGLVKKVLKAHVLLTDKAITKRDKLPEISRRVALKFFEDQNAKMDEILKKNTPEAFQKKWKDGEFTYDPNLSVATDFFKFLDQRGLVKGQTLEDFININPLNEVLTEMGKSSIK